MVARPAAIHSAARRGVPVRACAGLRLLRVRVVLAAGGCEPAGR
jgi:hypothetical protein